MVQFNPSPSPYKSSFALRSVIEVPLLRIQESDSSDLESVAQFVHPTRDFNSFSRHICTLHLTLLDCRYYSSHIVAFIRLCLQVVPITMFRILTDQVRVAVFCFVNLSSFLISHAHRLCPHPPLTSDPHQFFCPQTRAHPLRSCPPEGLFAS